MSTIRTGRCACGAVRIEARGDPVAELHCQCRHCQLRSGTGHSSFLVFAGPEAVELNGETRSWSVTADSGNEKYQAFCPDCGTPTHMTFPANPDVTAISAALLDSPDQFAPKFVTYAGRALPWDSLDPVLARFDQMPKG
ncbi:GFA family protein [Amorphus sp. 3PC139-8]|uniref:GFA family protein n=1 Tax=Amorphus sp. 3PC139-8 TaxID=2735676 RepID=UPI00345DB304